jgi:hypothetical protein
MPNLFQHRDSSEHVCPQCGHKGIELSVFTMAVFDLDGQPLFPGGIARCKRCHTTWKIKSGRSA